MPAWSLERDHDSWGQMYVAAYPLGSRSCKATRAPHRAEAD